MPGRMNNEAISLQKDKIFNETQRIPMNANACVVGEAHLSCMTGIASIFACECVG